MQTKPTAAILFLSDYGLRCTISTRGSRLLDALNDSNSRFLTVDNAQFFQRQSFQPVVDVPETVVVKSAIQLVVIDEMDGTDGRLFFATLDRKSQDVVVSLPSTIVEGTAHPRAAKDSHGFLSVEVGSFFAVTNATIRQLTSTADKLECRVALIHTNAISSLCFGARS